MSKNTKAPKKSHDKKKKTAKTKRILDLSNVAQSVTKLTQVSDMKKKQQRKAVSLIESAHVDSLTANLQATDRTDKVVDSSKQVTIAKIKLASFPKKKATINAINLLAAFAACGYIDNVTDPEGKSQRAVKGFTLDTVARAGSEKLDWDYQSIVNAGYAMSIVGYFKYLWDKVYQVRCVSGVYNGAICFVPLGKRIVGADGGYSVYSNFKKAFDALVEEYKSIDIDWVSFTQMFGKHRICK